MSTWRSITVKIGRDEKVPIRFLTPFPPHFSQRSLNSLLNLFPIHKFGFGHHAVSFVHISSNTRDRPDSPGPCEKCIGKAEPSKSLSLSLPYLSVMLLDFLAYNLILVLISAMNQVGGYS